MADEYSGPTEEQMVGYGGVVAEDLRELLDPGGLRQAAYLEVLSVYPDTPKSILSVVANLEGMVCGEEYQHRQEASRRREEKFGIPPPKDGFSYFGDRSKEIKSELIEYANQRGWDKYSLTRAHQALNETAIGAEYPAVLEFVKRLSEKKSLELN